ncbi:TIM barrel protein [Reichenbachiella sp. MALMAid0571]|uniref:sugar phosphate isomerase/epimerase family protein n=1 Tax=Reichenbachiella sp. MALMAid0571 TaxID=3143939 RepID=UPI0032DEA350
MPLHKENKPRFTYALLFLVIAGIVIACSQTKNTKDIFAKENLVAWCIVPFDTENRSPEERASMLNELGITSLAWDWREKHLPLFEQEIDVLKKSNIELKSVWFYVTIDNGKIINNGNETILEILEKTGTKTDLWVSIPEDNFEGMTDEEKVKKGVELVNHIYDRAEAIGCSVSLYNHGGWSGMPENMVKIIEASGHKSIGIIYNFHHAHLQLSDYEKNIKMMTPYLNTVNLNGMEKGGEKILPLGEGNLELDMMNTLQKSGFQGSIGILGHKDDEDVKISLQRNLDGMKKLLTQMGNDAALKTYTP